MDAILYVDRTGVPWRYLPHDFAPRETVYGHFAAGGRMRSSTASQESWGKSALREAASKARSSAAISVSCPWTAA
ncbi:Putative transposase of IS4/5 family [Streptomyces radiopugnans]|uniref:Putative transposase of IS4/5 family n=1 Tax=Streptomyces radiopugnans TaxID=403935 RepID=A0A1H9KK29_9ACTN|nr:Putative transposase of IS4/5 family [Streptomyces radiopugnans]